MQAFILAAGNGERLRPLTTTQSKCMIPVAGKPIIKWVMNNLKGMDIHIVIRKEQKDLEDFAESIKAKIIYQEKALGTAHALMQCENYAKNSFIVCNGDDIFLDGNLKKKKLKYEIGVACYKMNDTSDYGRLDIDNNRKIKRIIEKEHGSGFVNCGAYLFDNSVFTAIKKVKKSKRGEFELTDAINILARKTDIEAFPVNNWQTINYPWDILDANGVILEKHGSDVRGEIRKGVVIEEPVFIDEESVIGPNCFIRKYSSIGKNCKIGNAVEIKNSIVMDNNFICHLSYVGDSIIGKNCNIGGGAMFANLRLDEKNVRMKVNKKIVDSKKKKMGAIVGDNVKMGVNTTVMPGKKIEANSIIQPCSVIMEDVE